MTFLYPELPPQGEAAPKVLASEAAPTRLATPTPGPSGEVVRHILVGFPEAIREAIYRMHRCRYVEQAQWTGPIAIGPSGIHIDPSQGQMLAYMIRLRALDAPIS